MAYVIPIKTALLFFPSVALLFTIPFIIYQYRKYGSLSFLRGLILYSFILYMITIYFLVILPLPKKEEVVYQDNMIRIIPFGFIKDIINETSFTLNDFSTYIKAFTEPCIYTVVLNIFMTIPFGMYLRYYFQCNKKRTLILSFLLSLFFELTQLTGLYFIYPYQYRVFDVDDLITNTLGGVIGYFVMGLFQQFLPTREELDEKSIKKGMVVSGLRRITIAMLDFFTYLSISIFVSIFIPNFWVLIYVFIGYYIVIPICWNIRKFIFESKNRIFRK